MLRARLFWHIFVTGKTQAIVAEQLHFVKLQPFSVSAVITFEENCRQFVNPVLEILKENKVIDVVAVEVAKEFEFDTLKYLYRDVENYEFLGYFHTKGAVMQTPNTACWRNLMNMYTVQMSELFIDNLTKGEGDFIGVFGTSGLKGQMPYVAGNFWWSTSSYIKKLPSPVLLQHNTRYDCELWIGLGGGKMIAFLDERVLTNPISTIAEKYNTDKNMHGYIPFYNLYLAPFRYQTGKLLEIGVYQGESIKLWQEALPHFLVDGVDIEDKPEVPAKVYVGDQADRIFLSILPDYDIIIDDGGHRSRQQIISLLSKVQSTRLYVIEDLHTSLPELYPSYHEPGEITCLDYLRQYPHLKPDYICEAEHQNLNGKKIYIEQGVFSPIAFLL